MTSSKLGQAPRRFIALFFVVLVGVAQAQVVRPFAIAYQTNAPGDIYIIGNTLMTCPASDPNCAAAQGGAANQNNNFDMVYVDVDGNPSTFNSSQATLSLPAGSSVLWAGLYWGADSTAGTNGSAPPNPAARNQALFATPVAGYQAVTASKLDNATVSGDDYQAALDVTALVQAGGNGTYALANVQAGTGQDRQAGWALVVVVRNNAEPFRNLTVFDGFGVVNAGNPVLSTLVSGFLTPATGAVGARIGAVVYEGDRGYTGDNLNFNGTDLTNSLNPSGDVFNSTISRLGVSYTDKNPNYDNQLGFDADIFDGSGILANGANSATVGYTSGGETYFPGVLTTAIDIFTPNLTATLNKTVQDTNGGNLLPGDILEYTVTDSNTGQDGATNTVLTDPIPVGTTYIPGSLSVVSNASGAATGAQTDAPGDDIAEYDPANNRVVFRMGQGASATLGGLIPVGQGYSLKFRVRLNPGTYGKSIANTATVNYNSQTLGTAFSESAPASTNISVYVLQSDLTVDKTGPSTALQGGPVTYTIKVWDRGPDDITGATVRDTVPAALTGVTWTCTASGAASCGSVTSGSGNALNLTTGALPVNTAAAAPTTGSYLTLTVRGTASAVGSVSNTASVAVATDGTVADPTPGNNSSTATTTVNPAPQQIGVAKAITSSAQTGPTTFAINYSTVVKNYGQGNATKVQMVENLVRAFSPVPAANLSVSNLALGAGSPAACVLNTGFTGKGNNTLLDGSGTLTPGQQCVVTYTVTADVGSNPGPFDNTVYGSSYTGSGPNPGLSVPDNPATAPTSPAGTVSTDLSNNGTDPNPSRDGNPNQPAENVPTPFNPTKQQIGVAKAVSGVTQVSAGVFDVQYLLTVKNLGKVPATNVQVTDSLAATYPAPATFALQGAPVVAGGLTSGNAAYNANSDTKLLGGNQTLAVNGSATITLIVRVTTNVAGQAGPFNNSATATSANTPGGPPVSTDVSNNGTDPDPNGNGNPGDPGESVPTPISLPPQIVGIAKAVTSVNQVAPGVYDLTYTLTVKNLGNVPATNVQVTDNLTNTFPAPATSAVQSAPIVAGGLTGNNAAYNGNSDAKLLAGNQTLAVNGSATVNFTVRVTTNGATGPFNNSAIVSAANTPGGPPIWTDTSTNGTNPDPNGNGNPSDPGESVPTPVSLDPQVVGVAKTVSSVTVVTPGVYDVQYTLVVKNYGKVPATKVQVSDNLNRTFQPPATFTVQAAPVASGDLSATNAAYDGKGDPKLLSGTQTLAVGGTATVTYTARVTTNVNGPSGPHNNTAFASSFVGSGPNPGPSIPNDPASPPTYPPGTVSNDPSNNGTNPDPNGNGNPNEPGENNPTPVILPPQIVGIAKQATSTVQVGPGVFDVQYTLNLKNLGTVPATNVQITDNLAATFPAPSSFVVQVAPAVSGGLSANNGAYNGNSDTKLLAGNQTLAVGATATVTYTVRVTTAGKTGPFNNTAIVTASNTPGGPSTWVDESDDGTNPDPGNDGFPSGPGKDDPTPVTLEPQNVGIAKTITAVTSPSGGVYDVKYLLTVKNLGKVPATNVQVTDDFTKTYPAPATFTIPSAPVVAGGLSAANAGYNGNADTKLLAGNQTLAVGQSATITVTVRVTPNVPGQAGPFNNSATVSSAITPGGTPVSTDVSNNGTEVDPNGNGNPNEPGENNPTPVVLPPQIVGIAKAVTAQTQVAPGVYNVTYTLNIKNLGTTDATNVQVTDTLTNTFPSPATYSVLPSPIVGGKLTKVNPAFDGNTDIKLLSGDETLKPGETATVTYTVQVQPNGAKSPFNNSAIVTTSATPGGSPLWTDVSDDGTNPDPNGNGNPGEPGENDPTPVSLEPVIVGLAKAVTKVTQVSFGVYDVQYTLIAKNYGTTDAPNVQVSDDLRFTYPAPATFAIQTAPAVSGGLSAANASYDGKGNAKLLAGNQTLAKGGTATITVTVRVTLNNAAGPFNNTAVVSSANTPGGPPIWTDTSTNGTNPDPNGNGNPSDPGEDAPTPVALPPQVVGLAKEVVPNSTKLVSPGVFEVTFLLTYKSLGAIPATNVQITDDLKTTFPAPATFVVTALPNTNGGLNANPGYDGLTDTRLLVGNQQLTPGQSGTVTFTVRVTQNGTTGRYNNSATVTSALTPGGPPVSTDLSDDGTNPDPGGDGNPSGPGKDDPTPVNAPVLSGVLKLTKVATNQTVKIGGTAGWILTATNASAVPVRNFTITDTLPVGLLYIEGSSTLDGTAIADPTITPVGAQQKLVWNLPNLAPGQTVTLKLNTRVTAAARSPLQNVAIAGGQIGPPGSPTTVTSTVAAASVKIDPGVFSDKAVIVGRVYLDKDGDNNYKEGTDIPIQGARVYLSNGRFAVSDDKGRYSITEVEPGLWAIRIDRITAPYVLKPVPDDQGKRGTRYVRINTGGGIYNEDFLFGPPGSDTAKVRSTKVTVGKVSLEKVVSKAGDSYTITLKLNVGSRVRNLKITDPLPPGGTRASVTGTPTPTVSGNTITLPGTLEPGSYTLTYTLSGNVPLERLVTDPDLTFDEVTR